MVPTVVFSPAQAFAFSQVPFSAIAVDIVQEDQTSSVAKVGVSVCIDSITTAYLLAHHSGIVEDPVIIAHCPPVSLVVDLHPALAGVLPIHKTDCAISYTKREREVFDIFLYNTFFLPIASYNLFFLVAHTLHL